MCVYGFLLKKVAHEGNADDSSIAAVYAAEYEDEDLDPDEHPDDRATEAATPPAAPIAEQAPALGEAVAP